jgi:hypothetical protein
MKHHRLLFAGATLAALMSGRLSAQSNGATASAAAPSIQALTNAVAKNPPEAVNGYLKLGFDRLASYKFIPPPFDPATAPDPKVVPPTGEEQIPADVKAWSGQKAILTGFMLPVKMENGLVTEFLLLKDPMMCCYGTVPNMNEWVVVKMTKGVKPLMDTPVSFNGVLKIGAMFENGYMTGIYLLEGEKMVDTPNS